MQESCNNNFICIYCNKICKNKNSLAQHQCRCNNNPNKIKNIGNKKSHSAWNKGLTKETDLRLTKAGQTYSANHKLGLHKDQTGLNNPSSRPEVKAKISATCLEKAKQGTWHKSLAKNLHYNYNGVDLDGSWELKYAQWLDQNNIKWIRPKNRFNYYLDDGIHYYTPDFYLVDTQEFVEVKGYKTLKDEAKWRDFPKDKKLIILFEKDLKDLGVI